MKKLVAGLAFVSLIAFGVIAYASNGRVGMGGCW